MFVTGIDFAELQARVFDHYNAGEFEEGLALLHQQGMHFPLHANSTTLWKACLAARTDQPSMARWFIEEGLAAGEWWAPQILRADPDLALLGDDPEFSRLIEDCRQRQQEAEASIIPMRLVAEPAAGTPQPWPLLIALHGASWNGVAFTRRWRGAAAAGWLLAAPQSTQASGPDRYGWMDGDRARNEVQTHVASLASSERIDASRIVIGGFSAGAELAMDVATHPTTGAVGVIAIAPHIAVDEEAIAKRAHALASGGLRTVLLVGRRDLHGGAGTELLAKAISDAGGVVRCIVRDDLSHAFPDDFDALLPSMLDFASGASS